MFLSNFALRRPVAIACIIIGLTLLGANSYRKLSLEMLPRMDVPVITIVTVWPGATPTDIEKDIAKRIEDAVGPVDGIKHIITSNADNTCQTQIEFHLGVDVNVAANDVREKIDTILSELPNDCERPTVLKFNINSKPVVTLALTGDATVDEMYDCADNMLRDRFSMVRGVANVELVGGAKREVHVLLDRDAIAGAGLTSMDVVEATRAGVLSIPSGRVRQDGREYAVRLDADYDTVAAINSLEVANRRGARRYIRDLGSVQMAAKELRQAAFLDGKPCINIRLVKKAEANAVEVVNNVRAEFGAIAAGLPGGMKLVWVTDDGAFIQSSMDSTTLDVWLGVALTAAILFAFLLRLRMTLIAAITMPLTILISLWFMELCHFTLNTSTLLAMGLSVGILVTDTIVVLESIVRQFDKTDSPWEAARIGTAQVAVRGVASTLTHVVVLLPIGLMASMVGVFFKPFAVTTLIVNVVSFFISFTLTPVLCATLLAPKKGRAEGPASKSVAERWEGLLGRAAHKYIGFLERLVRRRWLAWGSLAVVGLVFIHSLVLAPSLGFNFVPDCDRGEIYVKLEYPTYYDLSNTLSQVREVEKSMVGLPHLRYVLTSVGRVEGVAGMSPEGVNLAQILLKFDDKTARKLNADQLLTEVRQRLVGHADCIITASIPAIIGGQEMPVDLEVAGEEFDTLNVLALRTAALAREHKGFLDVDPAVRDHKPEIRVYPRRALLSDLNAPVRALAATLRANIEGVKASSYKQGARTYDIRVKLVERTGVAQVAQFEMPGAQDAPVLLSNFADISDSSTPVLLTRVDKRRIVKIYSNLTPELPLGAAVDFLSRDIDTRGEFPAGYSYRFAGDYERMAEAAAAFLEAGLLAIALTYLVLAGILGSFTRPILILVTIPLAFIGVVWALFLTATTINIFVLLGMVLLIGIVVTSAVLILDRARAQEAEGVDRNRAMLLAVEEEFRPVVLVTLAAALGMLPLAMGAGLGSELRTGIGVASVGGILVSAALTLFALPVAFLLLRRRESSHGDTKTQRTADDGRQTVDDARRTPDT